MKSLNYYDLIRTKDGSTTLITITHNNQKEILFTLHNIYRIMKQHKNIRKIIIIDQNSTDQTTKIILKMITTKKDGKIILITNNQSTNLTKTLKKTTPYLTTTNTVFIEPQLHTYPRQIQTTIARLRKSHIVIPNRFHKNSTIKYENKTKEIQQIKKQNKNHPKTIKDPSIPFKGFKTNILKHIINNTNPKQEFWKQTYKIIIEQKLKISQPSIEINTRPKTSYSFHNYNNFLKEE